MHVEISIGVKGIAEGGRYSLGAEPMNLLCLLLASAVTFVTRRRAVERLNPQRSRGSLERSGIDGRHPDSGLVDLEKVGDKVIKVDVVVGEVIEGEFLAVPARH